MTVELVPDHGVRIEDWPDLTYGMTLDDVRAVVERRAKPHRHAWGCGLTWTWAWDLDGVSVRAGGGPDRLAFAFQVDRRTVFQHAGREGLAAHQPVVFAGVDVFGWDADEVVECLRADGHDVSAGPRLVRVGAEVCLFRWEQSIARFTYATLTRPLPDDPDAPQYRI
ncbi:hypothetical protein [Catellatospora tritici]|uniref:hypothetical protein n=1 Tax=Catellatospora tritici TaxID=2851566 RepID=UPI001C2D9510|nr:hypothetical protein [Catellatospora tritici]MBV1850779.1 hypothetical protein [Catellatospora tritici]MBV1851032.1 hypothetical protein [Catellatospora tritici]